MFRLVFFCLIIPLFSNGQQDISIRVSLDNFDDDKSVACFSVEITGQQPGMRLASQNHRLFYNSSNMTLQEHTLQLNSGPEEYQVKLVQHLKGIDASGIGQIPFEQNLGFINYSIVLKDLQNGGISLDFENKWAKISSMCFEVKDKAEDMRVTLARNDLTAEYGKAFIELSAMDSAKNISSVKVSNYIDYSEKI